jgi:hypothetical protein
LHEARLPAAVTPVDHGWKSDERSVSFSMAFLRSSLAAYDSYLRGLAERGFEHDSLAVVRTACGPWLTGAAVSCAAIKYAALSLNFSTALFNALVVLAGAVFIA